MILGHCVAASEEAKLRRPSDAPRCVAVLRAVTFAAPRSLASSFPFSGLVNGFLASRSYVAKEMGDSERRSEVVSLL